jgi:hypothetical protein
VNTGDVDYVAAHAAGGTGGSASDGDFGEAGIAVILY